MKKSITVRYVSIVIFLGMFLFAAVYSSSCSPSREILTIAAVPTELNALVYVAEDRGLFTRNDLDVIFKEYDSGATAAAGMLNGEADIALAAEFPIVRQVLDKRDIINFGTVAKYENTYVIWRTDSGIKTIQDLKGKRIGVTLTTISEFYLGRTLELNGININQVTLVDTRAADSEKVVVNREVDAVVTWEPWVNQIRERLGNEVMIRAAQSAQYAYWNMVSTGVWTNNHPETINRLITALVQAEDYLAGHEDEARTIVRNRMNFDSAYMETIWPHYQFILSLDQSLITAMEDEARWMIENNLTAEKAVPRFIDHLYEDALQNIKPEAVNIIR